MSEKPWGFTYAGRQNKKPVRFLRRVLKYIFKNNISLLPRLSASIRMMMM